jgi:hypothetical protein
MMEPEMTEKESLELISKMINTAKSQIDKSNAFFYLLWGYLVVAASLLHYSLCVFWNLWKYAPYAWLLMFVGVFISIPYSRQMGKKRKVSTYIGRIIGYLWIGYAISISLLFFASRDFSLYYTPVILLFVAFAIFVSGIAFKFKPLIVGAIICWICAAITFRFQAMEQLLINAFAITAGYIIPGHLIYRQKDVQ